MSVQVLSLRLPGVRLKVSLERTTARRKRRRLWTALHRASERCPGAVWAATKMSLWR